MVYSRFVVTFPPTPPDTSSGSEARYVADRSSTTWSSRSIDRMHGNDTIQHSHTESLQPMSSGWRCHQSTSWKSNARILLDLPKLVDIHIPHDLAKVSQWTQREIAKVYFFRLGHLLEILPILLCKSSTNLWIGQSRHAKHAHHPAHGQLLAVSWLLVRLSSHGKSSTRTRNPTRIANRAYMNALLGHHLAENLVQSTCHQCPFTLFFVNYCYAKICIGHDFGGQMGGLISQSTEVAKLSDFLHKPFRHTHALQYPRSLSRWLFHEACCHLLNLLYFACHSQHSQAFEGTLDVHVPVRRFSSIAG